MKVISATLLNQSNGELLSVRWLGTDEEIDKWKSLGLVPANAEEVIGFVGVDAASLAQMEFDLLPVEGRVLN
jgi:hypothetical protein